MRLKMEVCGGYGNGETERRKMKEKEDGSKM